MGMVRRILTAVAPLVAVVAKHPVPVYDASAYSKIVATHPHGVKQLVQAPGAPALPVVHVFGSASERGEANGYLMAEELVEFVTKALDDYLVVEIDELNLQGLPEWLQKLIKDELGNVGRTVGNPVLQDALRWVRAKQDHFVHEAHDSTTQIFDEMAGMARGVCAKLGKDYCDKELKGEEAFMNRIIRLNYLPELIRMSCSMAGATRTATAHGKLVQMRTLDFGLGPFANFPLLLIQHKTNVPAGSPKSFGALTFPAFAGVVTGFNSAGLVQSEKVSYNSEASGYNTTCAGGSLQGCVPGTYMGEATPFVIRRLVEMASTKEMAEEMIQSAHRTWHVYLGLGDTETQDFDAVGYSSEKVKVWNSQTLPALTHQPYLQDVGYINMAIQPNHDLKLHDALQGGNLTGHFVASTVPHATGSGDVHFSVVDHGEGRLYVGLGTVTPDYTQWVSKACDAPVLAFDLETLWTMPSPSEQLVV